MKIKSVLNICFISCLTLGFSLNAQTENVYFDELSKRMLFKNKSEILSISDINLNDYYEYVEVDSTIGFYGGESRLNRDDYCKLFQNETFCSEGFSSVIFLRKGITTNDRPKGYKTGPVFQYNDPISNNINFLSGLDYLHSVVYKEENYNTISIFSFVYDWGISGGWLTACTFDRFNGKLKSVIKVAEGGSVSSVFFSRRHHMKTKVGKGVLESHSKITKTNRREAKNEKISTTEITKQYEFTSAGNYNMKFIQKE